MSLKNLFLKYVETQRAANECKTVNGPESKLTIAEYDKANKLKREILNMMEAYENRNS